MWACASVLITKGGVYLKSNLRSRESHGIGVCVLAMHVSEITNTLIKKE